MIFKTKGDANNSADPTETPDPFGQDAFVVAAASPTDAGNHAMAVAGSTMTAIVEFMKTGFNIGSSPYYGDGRLCFQIPNGTCTDVTANVWHQIEITVHQKTSTTDYSMDGARVKSGLVVDLSAFTGQTKFNVSTDDPTWWDNPHPEQATIFLDNIQVRQAPLWKPSTLMMFL